MKQFLLKLSAAFLLLLCCANVSAQDFEANGIFYNKLGENSCEVTYNPNEFYSGNVVIPSQVSDGKSTYAVTRIGNNSFSGCSELTGIEMPNTIKEIGLSAFMKCSGLKSVDIPSSVTRISTNAFRECTGLGSIVIPNSVTSMGNYVFQSCSGLDSVVIGNSLTSIGNYTFNGCHNLRNIVIPNSVNSIGEAAFQNCFELRNVVIPNFVTCIGKFTFKYCTSLDSIVISNSLTYISEDAFGYCDNLRSVVIPNSVNSIGKGAFYSCSNLRSVVIPNSVNSIGEGAFQNCSNLRSIEIPNSVNSIGLAAFEYCDKLSSVIIPNSVIEIGPRTFNGCSSLRNVIIPNSVKHINEDLFMNCYNLMNVTIGYSVKDIYADVFSGCSSISELTVFAPEPPSASSERFNDIDKYECTLYVPAAIADKYRNAEGWKEFKNIVEIPDTTSIPLTLMQANDGKSYGTAYLPVSAQTENGENVKLYYASAPAEGNVQLHRIKDEWAPSHEGFVVIDESGAKRTMLKVKYSSTENNLTDNALRGCLNDSSVWNIASKVYVLGLSNGIAGFYRPNQDMLKAYRAYMPADGQYRTLTFSFDNSVTGIEKIENAEKADDSNNSPIYDLSGRRVYGNLPQGIYVKNGKKFIVK